jgi:hypothetical protein
MKVAILGSTSHIAKGLISNFCQTDRCELYLFGRSLDRIRGFLTDINRFGLTQAFLFSEFNNYCYDVVINCVGIGNPGKLQSGISSILKITETYDNLVLDYLEGHPDALYINLSSGAAYGTDFTAPANEGSVSRWDINHMKETDYYGIAKMNSEAKHRAFKNRYIADIRVFGYFSRFIDLSARFMLTEIISCIETGKDFLTGPDNIQRDYIHPSDLYALIECCIHRRTVNEVYDAYSLNPVSKLEILDYFASEYGLKYVIRDGIEATAPTGAKNSYFSLNRRAQTIGYYPRFTSLDSISGEAKQILNKGKMKNEQFI